MKFLGFGVVLEDDDISFAHSREVREAEVVLSVDVAVPGVPVGGDGESCVIKLQVIGDKAVLVDDHLLFYADSHSCP